MVRDPLYRAIDTRLAEKLDPDLFELCAVELLRPTYPGLSPVRGGSDAGMDGAIPSPQGPPLPLVCTTATNVIRNLTGSLESYIAEGGQSRFAVLVTSQALTPRRRRNLEARARDLGFTLRGIHARDDLVGRLYQAPRWRMELLGLTGEPPALSVFPRTRRPLSGQPLVGREEEVAWLKSQEGDCLLAGQPGSGKTAILMAAALAEDGVFLVSEVRGEIADAIREQRPSRIFVDDAHRHRGMLIELLTLRMELGADFSVCATCWPAECESLQGLLGIDPAATRLLPPLPRVKVAEIVNAAGVHGPEALVAEILDQAAGLPGLAVTLARLCIQNGTAALARGDFLLHDIRSTLREIVGERALPILGAFSIGGRTGFELEEVAQALRLPATDVWETVTRVESGGVIKEIGRGALAVEPPAFREALVREVFFNGPKSLRVQHLIAKTPSPAHTAETLIRSRSRGAEIPDELVRQLLERCVPSEKWSRQEKQRAWRLYAYSGPESVDWILDRHPGVFDTVVKPALIYRPGRVLPILLAAAVDDERELPPYPDHPLRVIEDWVKTGRPGTEEALTRRRALLDVVRSWSSEHEADPRVVRKAIAIAFSPEFRASPAGRIDPRQIHILSGHLGEDELKKLRDWWPEGVEVLEKVGVDDVRSLEQMVDKWAFPGMLHGHVSEGFAAAARAGAATMLEDLMKLGELFPGVVAWGYRLSDRAGLDIRSPTALDPVYQVLFPREDHTGDWRARHKRQHDEARRLGAEWADEVPGDVAARLVKYDREGARTGRSWPRLTNVVADSLAEAVHDPCAWIDALVELGAQPDLVGPFVGRLLREGCRELEAYWDRLFDIDRYRILCIEAALCSERAPEAIIKRTLANLDGAYQFVKIACLRDQVPADRVIQLLRHPSPRVAAAAAEGLWHAREKQENIPERLLSEWRTAIIRHGGTDHMLEDVFRDDPELAREWLLARRERDAVSGLKREDASRHAVAVLDLRVRRELLETLDADFGPLCFFATLVGRDPSLFDVLLDREDLERRHLEPLEGRLDASWTQLARQALDAGYAPEDLAHAVHASGWAWTGNESAMWEGWAESFRALEEDEDPRIREVGRMGREDAESRAASARERERQEEVYGLD